MKKLIIGLMLLLSTSIAGDVLHYNIKYVNLVSSANRSYNIYAFDKSDAPIVENLLQYSWLVKDKKMDIILVKLKERDEFETLLKKQGTSYIKPWYLQESFLYPLAFILGYLSHK